MTGNVNLQTLLTEKDTAYAVRFKAVYDLLVDKVFAYVSYRVLDKDTATDIVQEVFIDLHAALQNFTYQSDAQFYSFVFLITKRKLAKHFTAINLKQESEVAVDETNLSSPPSNIEEADRVKRALNTLEADTREIVVLHHWSRFTFLEIASLLNMTESAVRVRHHRALKSLATTLTNQI